MQFNKAAYLIYVQTWQRQYHEFFKIRFAASSGPMLFVRKIPEMTSESVNFVSQQTLLTEMVQQFLKVVLQVEVVVKRQLSVFQNCNTVVNLLFLGLRGPRSHIIVNKFLKCYIIFFYCKNYMAKCCPGQGGNQCQ